MYIDIFLQKIAEDQLRFCREERVGHHGVGGWLDIMTDLLVVGVLSGQRGGGGAQRSMTSVDHVFVCGWSSS